MRRILLSLLSIGAVLAVSVFASQAFFSDTETSTGNILQAGAIDLKIDNTSYITGPDGKLVKSESTTWELADLSGHLFFDFSDLKPGDLGEDTISIHVNNNPAWLCAAARITEDSDVDYTEPELESDTTVNPTPTPPGLGELDDNIEIAFWADDGDNVYEQGEQIFLQGLISQLGQSGKIALVDSTTNIWEQTPSPFPGGQTRYIGKAWCFGDLVPSAVPQSNGGPLEGDPPRGTGFTCDGASSINNAAQTDMVKGDIQFYAVQSRNNASFTCSSWTPVWPTPTLTQE